MANENDKTKKKDKKKDEIQTKIKTKYPKESTNFGKILSDIEEKLGAQKKDDKEEKPVQEEIKKETIEKENETNEDHENDEYAVDDDSFIRSIDTKYEETPKKEDEKETEQKEHEEKKEKTKDDAALVTETKKKKDKQEIIPLEKPQSQQKEKKEIAPSKPQKGEVGQETAVFEIPIDARLEVRSGKMPQKVYFIDKETTTFGRSKENDVMLTDPDCSRIHFKIIKEKKNYVICDAGSTNGTLVNGKKVRKHKLVFSDKITACSINFEFLRGTPKKEESKVEEIDEDEGLMQPGLGGPGSQLPGAGIPTHEHDPSKTNKRKIIIYAFFLIAAGFALYEYYLKENYFKKEPPQETMITEETQKQDSELTKRLNFLIVEGNKFYELGEFEKAKEKFDAAIKIDPENDEIATLRNKAESAMDVTTEITETKQAAVEKSKMEQESEEYENKGLKLYNEKKYDEALDVFNELKEINPENELAQKYIPLLEELTSDEYKEKLKSNKEKELLEEQIRLAKNYYENGDIYAAIKELKTAKEATVTDEVSKKEIDRIIEAWDKELTSTLSPKLEKAKAFWENGEKVMAKNMLKEIVKDYPDYEAAKNEFDLVYHHMREEAKQAYADGKVYESIDDIERAITSYEKVLTLLEPFDELYFKANKKLMSLKKLAR